MTSPAALWAAALRKVSLAGPHDVDDVRDTRRIVVLNALTVVGMVFLTVYGVQTLRAGDYVTGAADLLGAFTLVCAAVYVRVSGNYATGSHLFVYIIGAFFLFLVISGGVRNTGPLWVYPFPLVSVYLLGPRGGAAATTLFLVAVVTHFITGLPIPADHYSPEFKQRFVWSFLNVCIFAYLHERTTAAFHNRVVSKNRELQKALTSLESAQEQLRQAQKMEAIGQLSSGVAHNFNNALQAILANLENLRPRSGGEAEALRTAESAARMAAGVASQLNLLARPDGEGERRPVQVAAIISEAVEMSRGLFDREVVLEESLQEELPLVSGHANQLQQVFLNLLLNARDAVEDRAAGPPRIEVTAAFCRWDAGACVEICVSDNGVGMDEETRARVFEPFYTTKAVGRGTGLGLSTVYGIIAAHAGTIDCRSAPGKGSTFSIKLPVTGSALEEEAPPAGGEGQHLPGPVTAARRATAAHKILVIEDEAGVRDPLTFALRACGYEVLEGRDGQEGWEVFEREREHVAAVLLDISMPQISGTQILDRIRAAGTGVKVIVTTGYDRRGFDALAADGWLSKPYRLSQAVDAVRRVLEPQSAGKGADVEEDPDSAAGR